MYKLPCHTESEIDNLNILITIKGIQLLILKTSSTKTSPDPDCFTEEHNQMFKEEFAPIIPYLYQRKNSW